MRGCLVEKVKSAKVEKMDCEVKQLSGGLRKDSLQRPKVSREVSRAEIRVKSLILQSKMRFS